MQQPALIGRTAGGRRSFQRRLLRRLNFWTVPDAAHSRRKTSCASLGRSTALQASPERSARLAAVTIGRTDTALGAFYRRLSARAGKSKAVTATARKIATLFYNALRHGMDYVDPGASYYETRYRERVVKNLHRRAKAFGFILQAAEMPAAEQAVS